MPRSLILVLLIGSIGGWISAFLGAWKDAPIEGFETLKFFRSPAARRSYAVLLSPFTTSYLAITMAALGYTIATLETYKTFFFPSKPRGSLRASRSHSRRCSNGASGLRPLRGSSGCS
jgi:hypothetical protein